MGSLQPCMALAASPVVSPSLNLKNSKRREMKGANMGRGRERGGWEYRGKEKERSGSQKENETEKGKWRVKRGHT